MRHASTKCTEMIVVTCGNDEPVHMSHEEAVLSEAAIAAAQEVEEKVTEEGILDIPDRPVVTAATMKAPRGMPVRFYRCCALSISYPQGCCPRCLWGVLVRFMCSALVQVLPVAAHAAWMACVAVLARLCMFVPLRISCSSFCLHLRAEPSLLFVSNNLLSDCWGSMALHDSIHVNAVLRDPSGT